MRGTRWSRPMLGAAAAFIAVAFLQVGLPIRAMFDERPARYGWQMYSTVSQAPDVWTQDGSGRTSVVDPLALMGDPRAEIRWTGPLAKHLCRDPVVVAVIIHERGDEERVACS
jgi:hypothetical protein